MGDAAIFFLVGAAVVLGILAIRRRFGDFMGQKPNDYGDEFPLFDMREHLNGAMVCDGVIFGPLGRVTSTFEADFDISWDGTICTMKEVFRYNDGSTQNREWRIEMDGGGNFEAFADDVPGKGRGEVSGPAVLFNYPITLPADAGGHTLKAFDCMYLTKNGTVVNRSQFRKFGFRVAELVATIRKKDTE
ncbi:DUF3833 family protein [Sulfitobacter guttiformis]|uniref:Uncharacterized protein DUF3833 n=1 Tax=Sulfitobacter guttiformis TaxID=74349 RepID=A0A420DTB7_9RHOB|nr:DUF3833 family protein [Sulfitobacter guttiformis]KIN74785.1 DUF3833 domain containing protein [Sulfitobacter guttiformis KCTC 32187]RKE97357.1 uncharacterized protein DUF3833 [Sulfitobacter guttiformis]